MPFFNIYCNHGSAQIMEICQYLTELESSIDYYVLCMSAKQ